MLRILYWHLRQRYMSIGIWKMETQKHCLSATVFKEIAVSLVSCFAFGTFSRKYESLSKGGLKFK